MFNFCILTDKNLYILKTKLGYEDWMDKMTLMKGGKAKGMLRNIK